MVQKTQRRKILSLLTPETDSWQGLLRTIRIWFCCGVVYGLLTSAYVAMTITLQAKAIIMLSLLFVLYGGLKGAALGAAVWLSFAAVAWLRKWSKTHLPKV